MCKRFVLALKKTICICVAVFLSCGIYGCMASNEGHAETEMESESFDEQKATDDSFFLDYNELEQNHNVLVYDICSSPRYDYENTPLAEYVEEDIAWNEEMSQKAGKSIPLEIDYHVFDFNDDGIEDYLLCESGPLFNGNGSHVDIFIQEEDGIRQVLSMPMILHNNPSSHEKLMILDEKTNGYYAIVPPYKNFILRYDETRGWYDTGEERENALKMDDEQSSSQMDGESSDTELEEKQTETTRDNEKTAKNNNYFLNFEDLEQNHNVLVYDICSSPRYDYENTPLAEYVEEAIEHVEEESKRVGRTLPIEIDYHMFDFNDDGREDYLLCIYGTNLAQDDEVAIFIQEDAGIKRVFYIEMTLHGASSEHDRLTVLDEKTNGYYAIAPSYGNYILRYDVVQERYDFNVKE